MFSVPNASDVEIFLNANKLISIPADTSILPSATKITIDLSKNQIKDATSNVFNYPKATLTFIQTGTFNFPSAAVLVDDNRSTNDCINNPSDTAIKEIKVFQFMIFL